MGTRENSGATAGTGGDGAGGGVGLGVTTGLQGPPSPTKKEPRTDYDKSSLDYSPRLEHAVSREEDFAAYLK